MREDGQREEGHDGADPRDDPELGHEPPDTGEREEHEDREEDGDDGEADRLAAAGGIRSPR